MSMDAAPVPGAEEIATRVTALPRPWVRPRLLPLGGDHAPDDPAVRRFWTALVGPGAVADLLRLTAAAHAGREVRRPLHLPVLLREGLVERHGETILVYPRVPGLRPRHLVMLHPALRAEYRRLTG